MEHRDYAPAGHERRYEKHYRYRTKDEFRNLPALHVPATRGAQNEIAKVGTDRDLNEGKQALRQRIAATGHWTQRDTDGAIAVFRQATKQRHVVSIFVSTLETSGT